MAIISRAVFIVLSLVLAVGVVAFIAMMLMPMDPNRTFSRTMSLQMASDINAMIAAPVGVSKMYPMPKLLCSIDITPSAVNVTTKSMSFESPILISKYSMEIEIKQPLLCSTDSDRYVLLNKTEPGKIVADIFEPSDI